MTTAAPDLLATIVAASRRSAEERAAAMPLRALDARLVRPPEGASFERALRDGPAPRVIAECKRRSPSRGILRHRYDPAAHAAAYAANGAAAVSVLTEPTFFDGALEHLAAVRAAVALPLLRKDFVVTEYQVAEAAVRGADAVLLIVAALDDRTLRQLLDAARARGLAALVEVHDAAEWRRARDAGAGLIGVNSRDLRTLDVDPNVYERLARDIVQGVIAVAESGIRTADDVARLERLGYSACLVGERLIGQPDPGAALRELRAR